MFFIHATGFNDLLASLDGMKKQIPYAVANGVNAMARIVKDAEQAEIRKVFKSPNPFTQNAPRMFPAKAPGKLEARVWLQTPPNLSQKEHYLLPQIVGGGRPLKPYEMGLGGRFTMPGGGMKLDQYGNMGRGQLTKILSQSGSFRESGFKMNRTRKGGKAGDMFMLTQQRGGLQPGIYERTMGAETGGRVGRYMLARAMGAKKSELNKATKSLIPRGVKPVLIFPKKAPSYGLRLDFFGVAQRQVDQNLRRVMEQEIYDTAQRQWAYLSGKGLR